MAHSSFWPFHIWCGVPIENTWLTFKQQAGNAGAVGEKLSMPVRELQACHWCPGAEAYIPWSTPRQPFMKGCLLPAGQAYGFSGCKPFASTKSAPLLAAFSVMAWSVPPMK